MKDPKKGRVGMKRRDLQISSEPSQASLTSAKQNIFDSNNFIDSQVEMY